MSDTRPDAWIVLTGGAGRRLGGADKAMMSLAGRTLLDRAIDTAEGNPVSVVGPPRPTGRAVAFVQESPPGGGPAAGLVAGLESLGQPYPAAAPVSHAPLIAVMAVDQVGVSTTTWRRLAAAASRPRHTGAVLIAAGRPQYGVMVARLAALRRAVASRESWHGAPLRALVAPLLTASVAAHQYEADDIDTPEAWAHWQARVAGESRE